MMSIHTFEATYEMNFNEYTALLAVVRNTHPWYYINKERQCVLYYGMADRGINIILYTHMMSAYCHYKISPARVLKEGDYVSLFDTKRFHELCGRFNDTVGRFSKLLPKLEDCKLKRMDFCVNIRLDDQNQAEAYIDLMRRADLPHHMKLMTMYDKKSKRSKLPKDCFTFCSEKSEKNIEVSIYNKQKQMIKQNEADDFDRFGKGRRGHYYYTPQNIADAEGIIRIEVRCMKKKINSLRKQFGTETIEDFFSHANVIQEYLFQKYVLVLCSSGNIMTLNEARQQIETGAISEKKKRILLELISQISVKRSTFEASKAYAGEDFSKYTKWLGRLGISKVLATEAIADAFDDHIPTLPELYNRCFMDGSVIICGPRVRKFIKSEQKKTEPDYSEYRYRFDTMKHNALKNIGGTHDEY